MRVGLPRVHRPVAVVPGIEAVVDAAPGVVGVRVHRREPDGAHAELVEVALAQRREHAREVAAVPVGDGRHAAGAPVVHRVAVAKAVGEDEVQRPVAPLVRRGLDPHRHLELRSVPPARGARVDAQRVARGREARRADADRRGRRVDGHRARRKVRGHHGHVDARRVEAAALGAVVVLHVHRERPRRGGRVARDGEQRNVAIGNHEATVLDAADVLQREVGRVLHPLVAVDDILVPVIPRRDRDVEAEDPRGALLHHRVRGGREAVPLARHRGRARRTPHVEGEARGAATHGPDHVCRRGRIRCNADVDGGGAGVHDVDGDGVRGRRADVEEAEVTGPGRRVRRGRRGRRLRTSGSRGHEHRHEQASHGANSIAARATRSSTTAPSVTSRWTIDGG